MVDILRTTALTSGLGGADFLSMWWVPGTAGGSTSDATDCLARFRSFWNALGPKISTGINITFDPVCIVVNSGTGFLTGAFAGTTPAIVVTSGGSSPLPLQTQGLISWSTAGVVNNRRVRGRTFVPAPDEGDNTSSGQPSASYTSQLATAVTALLTAGSTASAPCVWHRPGPNGPGSPFNITAGAGRPTWSVQVGRRS